MGWSEWDSYGLTITEPDFRANADVLASLSRYGWQYAMLDAGWYEDNPTSSEIPGRHYQLDRNGRLIPSEIRFPSASEGQGFKRLAGWLHARGLKLGIHVMLGIPRQAVENDRMLAGSSVHASQAADTSQTCAWDSEFYAVKDSEAGQAWYDSIARQYADWGVDLIKLGCVSDHPFRSSEILQLSKAIGRTGRPIVLSLSPGPPPQQYASFVSQYAQMWRVSVEHWDVWTTPTNKSGFPIGLRDEFDVLEKWSSSVKDGKWVDPDALPNGWLGPHPPWGEARSSQLTQDEQRSEYTLWAFARAPLIEGANLTRLDPFTKELMTNRALLDIDQNALESHPVVNLPPAWKDLRIWEAQTQHAGHLQHSFAFFNLGDTPMQGNARWTQFGLPSGMHAACDGKKGDQPALSERVDLALPIHGSAVFCVR